MISTVAVDDEIRAKNFARDVGGEDQRLKDFEPVERRIVSSPLAGHRETHFHQRSARQEHLTVELGDLQARARGRIEDRAPFERPLMVASADQRMARSHAQLAGRLARFSEAVLDPAPR